ncbi:hypothetical protein HK101_009231 [Irineochytrium annulatum]|nr:hypothetical protein HK101_009231 [Irineochytrium annulatum]
MSYAKIALANRLKALKHLSADGAGAVYLRGLGIETRRWTDTEQPFRQESYMTGVSEPDAHLVISLKTQQATLLVPKYDDDHALWSGRPPTLEALKKAHGLDVHFSDQLSAVLGRAVEGGNKKVHALDGENVDDVKALGYEVVTDKLRLAITEARVIKSPDEIELMRAAGKVSGDAHVALMKSVHPGVGTERELHGLFVGECWKGGAPTQAYTGIMAAGRNGATLHYIRNDAPVPKDGREMILVDAACERECYASDITRTYPVGGKFEGDFKTVYEIVLDVQKAVLKAMKPGIQWEDMHRLAESVTCDGLLKAGIVKGSKEELLKNHIPALFFPHGLGHLIGIDVHDCGGYPPGVERIPEPGIRYLRMRRPLTPGMVVTVEPGCYFVDAILEPAAKDPNVSKYLNLPVLERFWKHVGGVRIEDDVAITETGIDNLTGWVPKDIDEIEKVMKK